MGTESSATLEMVKVIARGLGSLRERVVFLGGAATSLLIMDPALPHIRITFDVDVIEVLSGYHSSSRQAFSLAFTHDLV